MKIKNLHWEILQLGEKKIIVETNCGWQKNIGEGGWIKGFQNQMMIWEETTKMICLWDDFLEIIFWVLMLVLGLDV